MVDVGVAVVSRFGAKALSLTSVARQAGVARATAYRMFGGRDALVAAIVDREVSVLRARLKEWSDTAPDAAGKVRIQVIESLRYIREHQALQYILRNEPEEIVRTLVSTTDAAGPTIIHSIITAAIPDLEPEVGAQLYPNPAAAAEFMVRAIYSFMLIPEGAMSDDEAADLVVRAIVRQSSTSS